MSPRNYGSSSALVADSAESPGPFRLPGMSSRRSKARRGWWHRQWGAFIVASPAPSLSLRDWQCRFYTASTLAYMDMQCSACGVGAPWEWRIKKWRWLRVGRRSSSPPCSRRQWF